MFAFHHVTLNVRNLDAAEVQSRAIGEHVMEELSQLDQVAYVRFASVYRSFEDIAEFQKAIEGLQADAPAPAQDSPDAADG